MLRYPALYLVHSSLGMAPSKLVLPIHPDGYAVKLGDGEFLTGGFDFKLTAVDPKHVYAGFFVSRNADVTFTDIEYTEN